MRMVIIANIIIATSEYRLNIKICYYMKTKGVKDEILNLCGETAKLFYK
jgi:hypothetical protein